MGLKQKLSVAAGALLIAGGLLTGAAFANTAPETAAPASGTEATMKANPLSAGAKEVMTQLQELRKSVMEKLQSDSKSLVEKAVTEGKITQEEADKLLKHGGPGGRGHGHGGPGMGGPGMGGPGMGGPGMGGPRGFKGGKDGKAAPATTAPAN